MKTPLLVGALILPLLTGCVQAGTIFVNAQATVPASVVKDAAGVVNNLADGNQQAEEVPPAPPVKLRMISGAVRRASGKPSDDLAVVITQRQGGALSTDLLIATASVKADGRYEIGSPVSGEFILFVTKGGFTKVKYDQMGFIRLTFSKNTDTFAPKIDLSIPEDPNATIGLAITTVPEWMDNL